MNSFEGIFPIINVEFQSTADFHEKLTKFLKTDREEIQEAKKVTEIKTTILSCSEKSFEIVKF